MVGAGVGAGAGGLVSHGREEGDQGDVEDRLPLNSSGIVAIFEERWAEDIDKALSNASNVTKEKVDKESAEQVKAAASKTSQLRTVWGSGSANRSPPGAPLH